jgi:3-oxoacyl-[acyl-carrier protein] reductase
MDKRVALVTGGSRGIGKAIVLALVQAGWQVVSSYLQDKPSMQNTQQQVESLGCQLHTIQADLSQAEDRSRVIEQVIASFGKIDLLVNNAGMAPRQRLDLLEMQESSYDEVLATNLKGPFFLTQQVARVMLKAVNSGESIDPKIINITSVSSYTSSTNRGEYCLSKAGMSMLTQLFADRLAEAGILVYEIRPGIIDTDMTAPVHEKYERMIQDGLLPLKRWGKPDDIARVVVALAEGVLSYSTGEIINIDGGFHLRRL